MKAGPAALIGVLIGVGAVLLGMALLMDRASEGSVQHTLRALDVSGDGVALPAPRAGTGAPGHPAPLAVPIADAPAAASDQSAVDARVGLLVYGALIEPSGEPAHAQSMGVRFVSSAGEQRDERPAADGTYAVTGLQPGTWTVITGLTGYRPTSATLQLDASRPVTRFDIVVEPAVRLVVSAFTPDGRPLMDALREQAGAATTGRWDLRLSALASVEPLGALPTQFGRSWDTYGVGHFMDRFETIGSIEQLTAALPPGALGLLDVGVPLPVHVTLVMRNAVLASQRVEPGQGEVVFRVSLDAVNAAFASLTARFVDAVTRAPLEGVELSVSHVQTTGGRQAPSDASGVVRCEQLIPGGMRFEAERDGYERLLGTVTLVAGQLTDLGDVALSPATSISGIVLDEQGRPTVADLGLSAVDAGAPVSFDYSSWGWQSSADGTFTIDRLGRRRYVLRINDDERASTPVFVDTRNGDATSVVLRVEAGQPLSVYLSWPTSVQLGMRVRSDDGVSWTDWDGWSGQYVWKGRLPRGHFVAESYDGAKVLQSLPFEVADAPVALTLTGR